MGKVTGYVYGVTDSQQVCATNWMIFRNSPLSRKLRLRRRYLVLGSRCIRMEKASIEQLELSQRRHFSRHTTVGINVSYKASEVKQPSELT